MVLEDKKFFYCHSLHLMRKSDFFCKQKYINLFDFRPLLLDSTLSRRRII